MRNERTRTCIAVIAISLLFGTALGAATTVSAAGSEGHSMTHMSHSSSPNARSKDAIKFRNAMRKLWEDHIIWTRQFIVSALADLPDTGAAAERLLANQDDIGDAIKPFYGNEAGEQLSSLLRDHILIAADLVTAAKEGDEEGMNSASQEWSDNAKEIADFLHEANPTNWPRKEMRSMMAEHLEWTLTEASSRLNEDWASDVAAYDRIHRDILHMADMLSRGIIAQFPGRF